MRSNRPFSSGESIDLVSQSPNTKVILSRKRIKGKLSERYYIIRKDEPQFSLEYNACDNSDFIWQSKSNKLLGVIKDGEIKKPKSIEKIFFLSKLDLKPSENFILGEQEAEAENVSEDQVDCSQNHNHHNSQQDPHKKLLLPNRTI